MRKRGPKTILTLQLQKHICESLEKCNTIKTAAAYCNVSERSVFSWISTNPSFAAAVSRARAKAKAKLVKVIVDAAPKDWRASAFLLARTYPSEYGQRVEITETAEEPKKFGCHILYDLGNGTLAELLDFPKMGDPPEVIAAKQARLLGQSVETPSEAREETTEEVEAPDIAVSEAPPPQVVDKRLTGRIRHEWKINNGQP